MNLLSGPQDSVEWLRFLNTTLGCFAFGGLVWRLTGRWMFMSWLSRAVIGTLSAAVLVMGLGAARAAQLNAPFNELAYGALAVNIAACLIVMAWHRWLDPTRKRT